MGCQPYGNAHKHPQHGRAAVGARRRSAKSAPLQPTGRALPPAGGRKGARWPAVEIARHRQSRSRIAAGFFSPIPETRVKSSMDEKRPVRLAVGHDLLRRRADALSVSNSSAVAVLMLTIPSAPEEDAPSPEPCAPPEAATAPPSEGVAWLSLRKGMTICWPSCSSWAKFTASVRAFSVAPPFGCRHPSITRLPAGR